MKTTYKPNMTLQLKVNERSTQEVVSIKAPSDIEKYLKWLKTCSEERLVSVHLNAKNEVIGVHEVSKGTLSSSLVHPREVFKAALLANTYSLIIAHNHPSGSDVEPSREDIKTTEQLLDAGKIMGISILDHLIFGPRHPAISIREEHPHLWKV